MLIHLFTITMWWIQSIDSQTIFNATTINSSGDYFISNKNFDFNNGEINCNSNKSCHIQCINSNSCRNLQINCSNANPCIVDCDYSDDDSCLGLNLYIGSKNNIINCGYGSCVNAKIYTDYANYPSSNTILSLQWTLNAPLQIVDISGGTGYTDASKFKIMCYYPDTSGCINGIYPPYPFAKPTIVNSTGEYYFNTGSFVNISCTHDLLCFISCSDGDCFKSSINCGDVDVCTIICGNGLIPTYHTVCASMHITASNSQQFSLTCSGGWYNCVESEINIDNVKAVNIDCDSGAYGCNSMHFNLSSVQNVQFDCKTESGYGCQYVQWNIDMIDNFTADCTVKGGCDGNEFDISNTKSFDLNCFGGGTCSEIDIVAYENNDVLNLNCIGDYSCDYNKICIKETNMFNLDCCGDNSCNQLAFCTETTKAFTSIDCECGGDYTCNDMTRPISGTTSKTSLIPLTIVSVVIVAWLQ
eukprot:348609_1